MKNCTCREDLFNYINEVSFAVDDVKLFLDTHPCDEDAMDYFRKYSRMRNEQTERICGELRTSDCRYRYLF